LLTAIKQGIITVSTKSELVKLEQEREQLRQTMQNQKPRPIRWPSSCPTRWDALRRALADLTTVTQHQVDKARGIPRELMGEQIVLHPTADGAERYLTAEVAGDYAGLFRLMTGQNKFGGGEGS